MIAYFVVAIILDELLIIQKLLNLIEQEHDCNGSCKTNAFGGFDVAKCTCQERKDDEEQERLSKTHVELLARLLKRHKVAILVVLNHALGKH
jgi:hypothetical protein